MKKFAYLLLFASVLALASCEKEKTLALDDPDTPATPTDTIDPNTPTASFYAEMITERVPELWEDVIGSKSGERAKTGALFLVEQGTVSNIQSSYVSALCSWRKELGKLFPPVDSNYIYNQNDLIALFKTGNINNIDAIHFPFGEFNNVPYGKYEVLCVFGINRQDTLKTFNCSYTDITIDSTWRKDTVEFPAFIGHDNFWASF